MAYVHRVEVLQLETREPFTIARGGGDQWPSVLVEVEEGGFVGRGEGAPKEYYGETIEETAQAVEEWLRGHSSLMDVEPAELAAFFGGDETHRQAARAALDIAHHDLQAQRRGLSVSELLAERYRLEAGTIPTSSYTIGLADTPTIKAKVREAADYPILKVKLGSDRDLEILEAVRSVSDAELRVDANAAWSVDETRAMAPRLEAFGVTELEQPLAREDLDGYKRLHGTVTLTILVDESCRTPTDIDRVADRVDGINIKLSKCGGLAPAAEMVRSARRHGLRVMVGCFIESSVAITAAGSLGPYVDLLDLDGAALLANDPFRGLEIPAGRVLLPEGPGLGVVRREGA